MMVNNFVTICSKTFFFCLTGILYLSKFYPKNGLDVCDENFDVRVVLKKSNRWIFPGIVGKIM